MYSSWSIDDDEDEDGNVVDDGADVVADMLIVMRSDMIRSDLISAALLCCDVLYISSQSILLFY